MDPIANMFSQIKNAQKLPRKESLIVHYSKIKMAILEILKKNQEIADFKVTSKKSNQNIQEIKIDLKKDNYTDIQRVSRPSRRVYASSGEIPRPRKPRAMVIISTSEGLFEGEEARKKGLGGEIIAQIK